MEKLRQVNQQWFVVFATPGDRIFENGGDHEGGWKRKIWGAGGKELTRLSNFTNLSIHSLVLSFFAPLSTHQILVPTISSYGGWHFGQSNSQAIVPHYREVGRAKRTLKRKNLGSREWCFFFPRWEVWEEDPRNDLFLDLQCSHWHWVADASHRDEEEKR